MHQLQFMLSIEHKFLSSEMSLPLYMMLHRHYLTYGKDGALLDEGDDPAHPTEGRKDMQCRPKRCKSTALRELKRFQFLKA